MIKPQPKTEVRDKQEIHFSVGAVIRDGEKVLLIDRVKPPFGLAGVAGHVDVGEEPAKALKREVKEESGLTVIGAKLLFDEYVEWNQCSSGVRGHHWYVYDCQVTGQLKIAKAEAKAISWYNVLELKQLELEPVWKYWFSKLHIM